MEHFLKEGAPLYLPKYKWLTTAHGVGALIAFLQENWGKPRKPFNNLSTDCYIIAVIFDQTDFNWRAPLQGFVFLTDAEASKKYIFVLERTILFDSSSNTDLNTSLAQAIANDYDLLGGEHHLLKTEDSPAEEYYLWPSIEEVEQCLDLWFSKQKAKQFNPDWILI